MEPNRLLHVPGGGEVFFTESNFESRQDIHRNVSTVLKELSENDFHYCIQAQKVHWNGHILKVTTLTRKVRDHQYILVLKDSDDGNLQFKLLDF